MIRRGRPASFPSAAVAGFLAAVSLVAGCTGVRTIVDPVVVVETRGGSELGVSTEYGLDQEFNSLIRPADRPMCVRGPQVSESVILEPP